MQGEIFAPPAGHGLTVLMLKQRIDMGNQKQIPLDVRDVQNTDPRLAGSQDNMLMLDPGSPRSSRVVSVQDPRYLGSRENVAMTGSKLFKISRKIKI